MMRLVAVKMPVLCILLTLAGLTHATPIATILIDPTSTFIRQETGANGNVGYLAPLFIRLSDIGLAPGDDITITEIGNYFFAPDLAATFPSADTLVGSLNAAFTTTDGIEIAAAETTVNRLATPISKTGLIQDLFLSNTATTFVGGEPTDILEDFIILRDGFITPDNILRGSFATIPVDALFLVVGTTSTFAGDNPNDLSNPIGIEISLGHLFTPVPEPVSFPVLLLGIIGITFCRRKYRGQNRMALT
jgi:hypothetical protein